jgi:hypothetical protein
MGSTNGNHFEQKKERVITIITEFILILFITFTDFLK